MDPLRFEFTDLHPDGSELSEDLDWLLRFVAATFEIRVHGGLLFDEVEFPVLELANVLGTWLARDMGHGRSLDYEVTGGESGTLLLRPGAGGWLVDSVHRSAGMPAQIAVTDDELSHAIAAFIEELGRETERDYDIDVRSLLARVSEA